MVKKMRFPRLRASAIGILFVPAFLTFTSCIVAAPGHEVVMEGGNPEAEIYVTEAPPPPREEVVIGVAPGPTYVWVGGYWAWHQSNWYWVSGRWAARPRPTAVWTPGRWEVRGRGHVWIGGHWH